MNMNEARARAPFSRGIRKIREAGNISEAAPGGRWGRRQLLTRVITSRRQSAAARANRDESGSRLLDINNLESRELI